MKQLLISTLLAITANAWAQAPALVDVKDAWVRATVAQQKATGAFMQLTARADTRVVGVQSPIAGVAQIHEMAMEKDVMRMRELKAGLPLPAGQAVELKPGGYHVMLMDLKTALPKDSSVPLTLVFKNAQGVQSRQDVTLRVGAPTPSSAGMGHDAGHGHGHGMKH